MTRLHVVVPGIPVPQGSIRSLGAGRPSVHSNATKLKPWRGEVIATIRDVMDGIECEWPIEGPLSVEVTFHLPRPKSAPKSRLYPDRKPDVDKLARSTLDALTMSGAIGDDAQVVELRACKIYSGLPGMELTVEPMPLPVLQVVR